MEHSVDLGTYRTELCNRACVIPRIPHDHPQRIPVGMPGEAWVEILKHRVVRAKISYASWAAKKLAHEVVTTYKVAKWQWVRETSGEGHITSYDDVMGLVKQEAAMKQRLMCMGVNKALLTAAWEMAVAGVEKKLSTPKAKVQK